MGKLVSKSDVVDDLVRLSESTDGPLTNEEYRDRGKYSHSTVYRRFGSWNKAKEAAGIDVLRRGVTLTEQSADGLNKTSRWSRYVKIKEELPCETCGTNPSSCAMDFHHVNPSEKEQQVPHMIQHGRPWRDVVEEINKCLLICANCHREITHGVRDIQ